MRGKLVGMNGDRAVAYAVKQADVDVISAYPITPQTIIVETLAEYVNNGELDAAFIPVESEHSALSAAVGASLSGARVFTATSSQGLALMYEILWIAAGLRTTIVMAIGNRALSPNINIHCSHDDAYAARDTGWLQFFAENVQEAYDLTLMAFRISEDHRVLFPSIVNLDGFILTHALEGLYVLEDSDVKAFLPKKEPVNPVDPGKPMTYGALDLFDWYMEHRRQQYASLESARPIIKEVFEEYSNLTGRKYSPVKSFNTEGAEVAVMILGSSAGTARYVARKLAEKGKKIGVISLTQYRPFPAKELREAIKDASVVAVMDRSVSFGSPGAQLFMDVSATLIRSKVRPLLFNVIYGLGGRDLTPAHIEKVVDLAESVMRRGEAPEEPVWVGVRGDEL
ncbi:pyruvate ferredoxin oxidoreductase [Infirmifilum lucidum]|uniref:2-oxoacid oxidoreductase (ferredoxin) n=1 Tax=Infirmifilum lucidum TaxID=2776706 RepID=A0A7L9FH94_9CREN|nr:transketolase C-terminal domain-containing protein [Infirmifilum lucidum]QOJ78145.1 pyruvate ferredoxin oxidoreductase [Infirmifilum lucidum]